MVSESNSVAIEATIMGFREVLMEYFKEDCGTRLVRHNIRLQAIDSSRDHWFQRHDAQLAQCKMVYIENLPVMLIRKDPDTVRLFTDVFARSDELSTVLRGIEEFMGKYLAGVILESQEGGVS